MFWGKLIRQPIGGEFSFNSKFIKSVIKLFFSSEKINLSTKEKIRSFGIDIFLTTHALIQNFDILEVYLGKKIHNSRPHDSLCLMYEEVFVTLLEQICTGSKKRYEETVDLSKNTVYLNICKDAHSIENIDYIIINKSINKGLKNLNYRSTALLFEILNNEDLEGIIINHNMELITPNQWRDILLYAVKLARKKDYLLIEISEVLFPIFLCRVYSHFKDVEYNSDCYSESLILSQAELFA